ncbi:chaperone protein dnaJ 49-like isoform X1 [Zea mays]|jgi:DnaJ homolog subfamily B member 12|uniref:DNAJ heat shock N-terminal domain-containing protein n=1 Tax=Zea mays TaxID=4577 RepID=C0P4V7_MAIZE|nr:chaperone protein dnaJ 49-like [Zea mays]XP_035821968.1 chaperone protein dnaJ 49-like isoform X1 [Zea mays]ACN28023.1 unknown [Zea mays]ACN29247.1 unknown [Zea mays]ACR38243.1 unknown [Zea mays]ONM41514.1 DNAJ heat shock N-terminal domain-containing protein [Zea mays]|eukprot:NP_001288409.1 chaperone protein dnaJ 49-like [Zea mays]
MEGNKDDAAKCLRIGKGALEAGDRARAIKFMSKAKRLDPSLPIDDLLTSLLNAQDDSPASSSSSPPPPPQTAAAGASEAAETDGLRERKHKGKKREEEEEATPAAREYTAEQLEVVRQVKKHTRDYYQILGLEKDCSVEDVRKAYRKLSLKVHPDKNKAPGAEDAFKAVSKAFQCLSDAESRKRYDLVGSDEPVTHHRRASTARAYNGFYEDDFDPDEIFRNFFFGGMAPATTRQFGQFGTFHFRTGGMHAHAHAQQNSGGSTVRMLIQLLPVLLLLLLNFLPSSEPVYSLSRSYPYEHKFQTPRGVAYYVKMSNFEEQYPYQSTERATLERHVERDYYSIITQNCRVELQRRQWGLSYQTPHCDMLKNFEAAAK